MQQHSKKYLSKAVPRVLCWVETEDASSSQSMPCRNLLPGSHPSSPYLTFCTGSDGSASSAPLALHSHVGYVSLLQPKSSYEVYNWGIWAGLSQARTSTTILPAMQARHFLQGGKEKSRSGRRWQGGGGKDLGSDGKNKGVGFGKRDRLMECCFCPRRGLSAACSESRKGQGSMLSA